jgi:antirestriction protein ArdC
MSVPQSQSKGNGQAKIYAMITDRITELLEAGEVPGANPGGEARKFPKT